MLAIGILLGFGPITAILTALALATTIPRIRDFLASRKAWIWVR
jgi:hypothetical protein